MSSGRTVELHDTADKSQNGTTNQLKFTFNTHEETAQLQSIIEPVSSQTTANGVKPVSPDCNGTNQREMRSRSRSRSRSRNKNRTISSRSRSRSRTRSRTRSMSRTHSQSRSRSRSRSNPNSRRNRDNRDGYRHRMPNSSQLHRNHRSTLTEPLDLPKDSRDLMNIDPSKVANSRSPIPPFGVKKRRTAKQTRPIAITPHSSSDESETTQLSSLQSQPLPQPSTQGLSQALTEGFTHETIVECIRESVQESETGAVDMMRPSDISNVSYDGRAAVEPIRESETGAVDMMRPSDLSTLAQNHARLSLNETLIPNAIRESDTGAIDMTRSSDISTLSQNDRGTRLSSIEAQAYARESMCDSDTGAVDMPRPSHLSTISNISTISQHIQPSPFSFAPQPIRESNTNAVDMARPSDLSTLSQNTRLSLNETLNETLTPNAIRESETGAIDMFRPSDISTLSQNDRGTRLSSIEAQAYARESMCDSDTGAVDMPRPSHLSNISNLSIISQHNNHPSPFSFTPQPIRESNTNAIDMPRPSDLSTLSQQPHTTTTDNVIFSPLESSSKQGTAIDFDEDAEPEPIISSVLPFTSSNNRFRVTPASSEDESGAVDIVRPSDLSILSQTRDTRLSSLEAQVYARESMTESNTAAVDMTRLSQMSTLSQNGRGDRLSSLEPDAFADFLPPPPLPPAPPSLPPSPSPIVARPNGSVTPPMHQLYSQLTPPPKKRTPILVDLISPETRQPMLPPIITEEPPDIGVGDLRVLDSFDRYCVDSTGGKMLRAHGWNGDWRMLEAAERVQPNNATSRNQGLGFASITPRDYVRRRHKQSQSRHVMNGRETRSHRDIVSQFPVSNGRTRQAKDLRSHRSHTNALSRSHHHSRDHGRLPPRVNNYVSESDVSTIMDSPIVPSMTSMTTTTTQSISKPMTLPTLLQRIISKQSTTIDQSKQFITRSFARQNGTIQKAVAAANQSSLIAQPIRNDSPTPEDFRQSSEFQFGPHSDEETDPNSYTRNLPNKKKRKGVDISLESDSDDDVIIIGSTKPLPILSDDDNKDETGAMVLEVEKEIISLIDGYSLQTIRIPARSISCTHIQPFDLSTFLHKPLRYRTCHICSKPIPNINDLRVDGYLQTIFDEINANVDVTSSDDCIKKIELRCDANWSPVYDRSHKPTCVDTSATINRRNARKSKNITVVDCLDDSSDDDCDTNKSDTKSHPTIIDLDSDSDSDSDSNSDDDDDDTVTISETTPLAVDTPSKDEMKSDETAEIETQFDSLENELDYVSPDENDIDIDTA